MGSFLFQWHVCCYIGCISSILFQKYSCQGGEVLQYFLQINRLFSCSLRPQNFESGSLNCRRDLAVEVRRVLKSSQLKLSDMLCVISDYSDEDILWVVK